MQGVAVLGSTGSIGTSTIPHLELSVGKDPKNPSYLYHLGQAYALAGQKVKARTPFERALAVDPGFDGSVDAKRQVVELTGSAYR